MATLDLLLIGIEQQRLLGFRNGRREAEWPISTARRGPGQQRDSEQTPLGSHRIRACIGAGAPRGAVFVGRRPTGEIWSPELATAHPGRDWILSRILWLGGTQPGFNRFGPVDTMRRYIYLHGAPDDCPTGVPDSHGCIRLGNDDIIELFARVKPGTPVQIVDTLEARS